MGINWAQAAGPILGGVGSLIGGSKADSGMEAYAAAMMAALQAAKQANPFEQQTQAQKSELIGLGQSRAMQDPQQYAAMLNAFNRAQMGEHHYKDIADAFSGTMSDRFSGGRQSGDSGAAKQLADRQMSNLFRPAGMMTLGAGLQGDQRQQQALGSMLAGGSNYAGQLAGIAGQQAEGSMMGAMSGMGTAGGLANLGNIWQQYQGMRQGGGGTGTAVNTPYTNQWPKDPGMDALALANKVWK